VEIKFKEKKYMDLTPKQKKEVIAMTSQAKESKRSISVSQFLKICDEIDGNLQEQIDFIHANRRKTACLN
jgi:penicillin-binding protein-related factor A (putative recombinase)